MRKFVSILCLLLLSACATVVPGYDYHGKDDKLAQLPEHRALVETMGGYQSFSSDEVLKILCHVLSILSLVLLEKECSVLFVPSKKF